MSLIMVFMIVDKLRLPADLGIAIVKYRDDNKLSAVAISAKAGRSRTVLHKLEPLAWAAQGSGARDGQGQSEESIFKRYQK